MFLVELFALAVAAHIAVHAPFWLRRKLRNRKLARSLGSPD